MRAQYAIFHSKDGIFGLPAAKVDAITMSPIKWWSTYGSETPELAEIAIKVLAQPVSSSSAERNWSTYSFIHNVKRNRLNAKRADKLVFIHSNLRLLSRMKEGYNEGPFRKWDIDPEPDVIEDSSAHLEDLRWKALDNDEEHQLQNRNESRVESRPSGTSNVAVTQSSLQSRPPSRQRSISSYGCSLPSCHDKGKKHWK